MRAPAILSRWPGGGQAQSHLLYDSALDASQWPCRGQDDERSEEAS
jgi:hypothetical protein